MSLAKQKKIRGGHNAFVRTVIDGVQQVLHEGDWSNNDQELRKKLRANKKTLEGKSKLLTDLDSEILSLLCEDESVDQEGVEAEVKEAGEAHNAINYALDSIDDSRRRKFNQPNKSQFTRTK